MRSFRPIVLALVTLAFWAGGTLAPAAELGPAPRDAKGRFLNGDGPLERSPLSVRLGFGFRFLAGRFRNRGQSPARVANDGAFLRENARHSVPTATWVGHATLLIQVEHLTILTDPIWSKRASPVSWAGPRRQVAPGLAFEDLPPIDLVLLSHNHYDHMDLPTLRRLAERSAETRFLVGMGNGRLLQKNGIENVIELDWGEKVSIGDATVHCLPAQHWSNRGLGDRREALWASWAVVGAQRRFYFGGDTGYFSGFERIGEALGPFDLAALPIGAYEPSPMMQPVHLNPEEAVQAGRDLRAERMVGIHFGTFVLAGEPFDEPPRRFREAAAAAAYSPDAAWILKIGETREF
ncbi:MAG: MBL fold metallo-hydrolase [Deltaproteobacteria bacterium]|jgi:N-acyl-phosphatidylethanolamine-hydrolysing phospholipase D|nr:MBL fold metallo-hydrolase [Deltaproteobacteria bacterium]MBW2497447.1 MBL fold metallo-hydrolase [Deltaproteobacteria bacterium]